MRFRSQSGQSLVELLVGSIVTVIVLAGLTGILYTVSDQFAGWGHRVNTATEGVALARALQTDTHRYAPCRGSGGQSLGLCIPTQSCAAPLVTYAAQSQNGSRWVVTRTEASGPMALVVAHAPGQPAFSVVDQGTVNGLFVGAIRVTGIRSGSSSDPVTVPFRAPSTC
jgi:hypothetical protein